MTLYCELKEAAYRFPGKCRDDEDGARDFLGDQRANGNKLCCVNESGDFFWLGERQKKSTRSLGAFFRRKSGHDNEFVKHPEPMGTTNWRL